MAQLKIPTQPDNKITRYQDLLGVDYQSEPTEVGTRRSPDMVNMISDLGGNPVKRYGYRKVGNAVGGFVHYKGVNIVVSYDYDATTQAYNPQLHKAYMQNGELIYNDATAGGIQVTGTNYILKSNNQTGHFLGGRLGNVKNAFVWQDKIYVICEKGIFHSNLSGDDVEFNSSITREPVDSWNSLSHIYWNGEIPVVATSLNPDGTGGETTGMEGKNILSVWQTVTYLANGTSTEYVLPFYEKYHMTPLVEVMNSEGTWEVMPSSSYSIGTTTTMTSMLRDGSGTTSHTVMGNKITFNIAPSRPTVAGQDNVRITYAPFITSKTGVYVNPTTQEETNYYYGFYDPKFLAMLNSNAIYFNEGRLFVGVEQHAYYSRINKPLQIDDNAYFDVDQEIVMFAPTSSYTAVLTKDTGGNTVFLASGSVSDTTQQLTFSVKSSNAGVGAITDGCSGVFNDEPIFLSNTGIYGIGTNYLSEKYVVNRSGKINRKLCKESNLENAIGLPHNGYYYIAINNKMYVLDGRHKDTSKNGDSSYECYLYDNMPSISKMYVINDKLYFEDANYMYTFNEDMSSQYYYIDKMTKFNGVWSGEPTKCRWCSKFDDDNYPQYLKTLSKKGNVVSIVSDLNTSCDVTLCKDGNEEYYLGTWDNGKFKYSNASLDAYTKKKVKKYKRLQIKVENNEAEPFGLTSVVKTYTIGNYAKR